MCSTMEWWACQEETALKRSELKLGPPEFGLEHEVVAVGCGEA